MHSWQSNLLANIDLAYFIERSSGGTWQRARHLDLLCHTLEAVERGEIKRVIVTMPPRHGKSEVVSKNFPAWYLGKHPDREVIVTSYSADLAQDHSQVARDVLREQGPDIFSVKISKDSSAVKRWGVKGHRGSVVAVGIGGSITGRGAHVAIIDDPFKGPEDSHSPTQRRKVIDWYKTVLRTRLAPGGAIIVIHTRWHKGDLVGHLLAEAEKGGEQWTVIDLPAIAGTDDALGRAPGEPLWPERYSIEELRELEQTLGPYWWQCEYQQNPGDPEGHLFKRAYFRLFSVDGDHYVLHHPDGDRRVPAGECIIIQTCDPAASTKTTADYFVLSTWAITPARDLLLLDVIRERLEGPDQPQLFKEGYMRWRPIAQGAESAGLGKTLYQTLVRLGLPIVELMPDGDKTLRAIPMANRYKAGTVYHRINTHWLEEWEEELAGFPNAPHDDQVDTASYAAVMLSEIEEIMASREAEEVITYDDRVDISPV